ncbi:MAG TPA: MraY family glycosyltransferase [Ktedonobacterales bacterium]|nr:MraY family glycosyltransferase [Ktedonobacterales bacterium]
MLLSLPPAVTLMVGFIVALALSLVLTARIGRLCRRMGWLDQPSERRVHVVPVPRLGGVAMFLAFVFTAVLVYWPFSPHETLVYEGFLPAALFITAVMAYDDIRGLPAGIKLGLQTVAVLILILPGLIAGTPNEYGAIITFIHNPLHLSNANITIDVPLLVAIPFTWFWCVGMMNTINMADGLDGLAGGVTAINAVVQVIIALLARQFAVAVLCAIFAGSILGFLRFNWHPAKIFMGDSGSMFLGLSLAVLANIGGAKLATVLLVMCIPVIDVAVVIFQRLRGGRAAMHYDKRHLHHKLLDSGFSQKQIILIFYGLTGFFGLLAILALVLPDAMPFFFSLRIAGASLAHMVGFGLGGLAMAIILGVVIRRQQKTQPLPVLPPQKPASAPISETIEERAPESTGARNS